MRVANIMPNAFVFSGHVRMILISNLNPNTKNNNANNKYYCYDSSWLLTPAGQL